MTQEEKGRTWSEKIDISSKEVVERVKELIEEGNVRRLIVKGKNDEFRFELPVTASVAVGGVVTIMMPWLAALGAIAALVARVEIEIVRTDDGENPPQ